MVSFSGELIRMPIVGLTPTTINRGFAGENECPRQGSPMLAEIVKEGIISCPRHGWHNILMQLLKAIYHE
jgi:nitrite reductase/ring-hydroxylating ferredoxin subunit